MESINPATEEVIGEVRESTREEVNAAVAKAQEAFKTWGKTDYSERAEVVRALVKFWKDNKKEIAERITREEGKPLKQSIGEIDRAIHNAEWHIQHVKEFLEDEEIEGVNAKIAFEPVGVVGVVSPWNFPLSNLSWKFVPALLIGNTVVSKSSEYIPLFGLYWEEMLKEVGAPEGVFQAVTGGGEVGKELVDASVNQVCMTGSAATGKKVAEAAGRGLKRVILELGGSDPFIILEDADVNAAVEAGIAARFNNCGQICTSAKRFFVHESVYEEFKGKAMEKVTNFTVGNGMDNPDIGPLVSEKQLQLLGKQVHDSIENGAKVLTGGKRIEGKGFFFEPTVMENVAGTKVMEEEVFGPVMPINSFKTVDEAIKKANDTQYGLGSSVWSKDENKAEEIARALDTGMVWINCGKAAHPQVPWVGRKNSGMGHEHGKYGVLDLVRLKPIIRK